MIQSTHHDQRRTVRRNCLLLACLVISCAAHAFDYDETIKSAMTLRNQGDMAAAETLLREAYQRATVKSEAAMLLGMVIAFQERYDEALELVEGALEHYPDDTQLILARARIQSYQGEYDEALASVDAILQDEPANLEARNLGARISLYRRHYTQGKTGFLAVLDQETDNLEALIGMYDAETSLGNQGLADRYLEQAAKVAPGHEDVLTRQSGNTAHEGPMHELAVEYGGSRFDVGGVARWYERAFEYRHGKVDSNQQYIRHEHSHRFADHDSYTEIGAVYRRRQLPLDVAFGFGKGDTFLPERRIRVGTDFRIFNSTEQHGTLVGRVTLQGTRYQTGNVGQLMLDGEYYLLNSEGWLVPGLIYTRDENGNSNIGWKVGWNQQLNVRSRIGLAYSDSPETEGNRTRDTKTVHGYLRYRLTDRTVVRVDYSRHRRESAYRRSQLSMRLSYRF